MRSRWNWFGCVLGAILFTVGYGSVQATPEPQSAPAPSTAAARPPAPPAGTPAAEVRSVVDTYCVSCHNSRLKTAELDLASLDTAHLGQNAETWEKVIKKVRVGAMPPSGPGRRKPSDEQRAAFLATIGKELDREASAAPNPGRPPVHRLNRLQYTNAMRDLFGLEIDRSMLPADDTGYGFDNIGDVLGVSPGLLDRYLLAATKISRLVVGDPAMRATQTTYNIPYLALGQDERMSEDLPFGSRGGTAIRHYFPIDGEYLIKFTLQRSDLADGYGVRGVSTTNRIDVRVDRQLMKTFTLGGPQSRQSPPGLGDAEEIDAKLEVRFAAKAGVHVVGVMFIQDRWEMEGVGISRLPLTNDAYSRGRNTSTGSGRIDMGIDHVEISGPFSGVASDTSAVRKRVFICDPAKASDEEPCARQILTKLATRAFRRPAANADVDSLMGFYRQGRTDGSFDDGIQQALTRLLVDVNFLFKLEHDPEGVRAGTPYRLTDLELASRLSFFLWSSIPDDELLAVATEGKLKNPAVLEQQVRRMLADQKARVLPDSFFGQWLTTKNLVNQRPDSKVFPEFDENLREAFLEETRLFLEAQLGDDRPAPELLTANYTFVNERLAEHYGIPNIRGSHFRRVALPDNRRAGLLGQGSVLTITSYNDRTSVVQRGKWIMDNVFGTPPPPPPPNVPPFEATQIKGTIRQRMEQHRNNPVCATCHSQIDPLGFALENFDGVGKWRTADASTPIDPSGVMVNGVAFNGPADFRTALLKHQDAFLDTLAIKLFTYGLGRGVEPYDMPAVRGVIRDAAQADYKWSAIILGIVKSTPFQMRRAES